MDCACVIVSLQPTKSTYPYGMLQSSPSTIRNVPVVNVIMMRFHSFYLPHSRKQGPWVHDNGAVSMEHEGVCMVASQQARSSSIRYFRERERERVVRETGRLGVGFAG